MAQSQPKQVAIAILSQNGQYLLQLRDPIPTIVFPGQWGLFGGHIEPDETPEIAVQRELIEEIGYRPTPLAFWGQYLDPSVVRHVFHGELAVPLTQLELQEGWDLGLLSPAQIESGMAYSTVAQRHCPIGAPHRQILLEFHRKR